MKRDDSLWKAILEDIFDDFLRFLLPDADSLFDFEKGFEFLDKELEQLFPNSQDEFNPKYVDKLVKVYTKNGAEQWILVHIEVQGKADRAFSERMFTYFYRIFDKYKRPISAFAILTDSNRKFKPTSFEMAYLGTKIRYDFNSLKVIELEDAALLASNNPFAMVLLTIQTALKKGEVSEKELFNLKLELARRLLQKEFSKDKIRVLMNFLKLYVRFEKEEFITKFDEEIRIITNRNTTMGIEEYVLYRANKIGLQKGHEEGLEKGLKKGMEKGMEKGLEKGMELKKEEMNIDFVTRLLQKTNHSMEQIADIVGVPLAFVEKVKKTIE